MSNRRMAVTQLFADCNVSHIVGNQFQDGNLARCQYFVDLLIENVLWNLRDPALLRNLK